MSRATKRKAVRKIAKQVLQAPDTEFRFELPKSSFDYFKKQINERGGRK